MSSNNDINRNMDIIPLSLVYPINSRVYKNVLLIDTEVKDAQLFASSANDDTFPITYSSASTKTELSALLKTKFPNSNIERIGLVFTSNGGIVKTFLDRKPFFMNDDDGEHLVIPYSENVDFIISVLRNFNVKNIDYLACDTLNYPNWKNYYTILTKETGVIVGASNDKTGNIKYGGDWVMESTSQNIELIYFTKSIEYYSYLLDAMAFHTVVFNSTPINTSAITPINNTIYGTGRNSSGPLGIDNTDTKTVLTAMIVNVSMNGKIPKYISCGADHTIVLMNDASGTIWGTGYNGYGQLGQGYDQLGNGLTARKLVLNIMPNGTGKIPKYITCGYNFTIVLMTDGFVYVTGCNDNGQIGWGRLNGTHSYSLAKMDPLEIVIGSGKRLAKFIACGTDHTCILMTDGTIWGTGYNNEGQLGTGNSTGVNGLTQMHIPLGKTPKYIACGQYNSFVLMTDNTIYGTGNNYYGNLGNLATATKRSLTPMININSVFSRIPKYISCGVDHFIVLMEDGTIWGTGYNGYGQLGLGKDTRGGASVLTQMIIDPRYIPKNISCGGNYTIVLMNDGTVWGVGSDAYYQLGTGTPILDKTVLYDTTIAGAGAMLTTVVTTAYVQYTNITGVTGIAGMGVIFDAEPQHHTVVFNTSGTIYGTGYNLYGQLGTAPSNPYADIKLLTAITNRTPISPPKYISIGKNHTIVLMTSGEIWGTGSNWYGQLGTGNTDSKTTLTKMTIPTGFNPKYISCGENYTIVLMTDGNIWGTGSNWYGQLGTGNIANISSLTVMINTTGKTPKYVSCGQNHTMVLMTDGTIWGTGYNLYGQLGNYTTDNKLSLTQLYIPITTPVKTPTYVSCGGNHTIVLMTDGTIYGTGYNLYGQLGTDSSSNKLSLTLMPNATNKTPKYISCGQNHTMVLMTDASGSVYGTGLNDKGQLGDPSGNKTSLTTAMPNTTTKIPKYISCIEDYTLVLMTETVLPTDTSGSVYGTGYNLYGQLGTGDTANRSSLTVMTGSNNTAISYIANMTIVDDTPNSDICFPAGTKILTDQGIVDIETINPDINTINNKHIVDITKTVSLDKYLVEFEKNALGLNCPTENTRISQKHKIYYNGEMWEAKTFLGKFDKVVKVNYNGEILYNVLMEDHSLMLVNNLVCETLHPDNIIAKLFTKKCKYNAGARDKIYGLLTDFLTKSDHKSYNKIAGLVK